MVMAMDMVLVMDMADMVMNTDILDMDTAVMDTMDIMVSDLLRLRLSLDTVMDMDMVAIDTMDIMARGLLMLDMAMVDMAMVMVMDMATDMAMDMAMDMVMDMDIMVKQYLKIVGIL